MPQSYKAVVILVLEIISLSNAFNTLVPKNKELIYEYKSIIKTGTDLPAPLASQILLHGKLHLQSDDNATWVKLTDMKHHIYTGKINGIDELNAEFVNVPEDMHELMKPFRVIHNEHGKAMGIITNKQEKEYIRNMKRALASVLQMDVRQLNFKNMDHHNGFETNEHTIYGPQTAHYTVSRQTNNMFMIQKTYELTNDHMYTFSNTGPSMCDVKYIDPVTQSSQRQYTIRIVNEENVVEFMTASGEIFYTPFDAMSDSHYILANQTMKLINQLPVSEHWQIKNEHFDGLKYQIFEDNFMEHETIPDLTNGRKHVNVEKMMLQVVTLLHEIIDYLDKDHIQMQPPDFKQGQVVGLVRSVLAEFTLNDIKKLHTIIKQSHPEVRQLFYKIVPLVGTTATTMFIKHLFINVESEDMTFVWLIDMLIEMPLNVKVPTRDLLREMFKITEIDDVKMPPNLRATALAAFGTLVHRTVIFELEHKYLISTEHMMKMNIEEDYLIEMHKEKKEMKKEILAHHEQYVLKTINKMLQMENREQKEMYMASLYNMRLPFVAERVGQLLKETDKRDHDNIVNLVWTMAPLMMVNPKLAYKTLWPLMINTNRHLEIRIIAYLLLMESHPSVGRVANIFWFMQTEPCHELYNFHYTFMKNMAQSQDPCQKTLKENVARFVPYMRPSTHGISRFSMMDYTDITYGFGMRIQTTMISTNESLTMSLSTKNHLNNRGYDDEFVFVKIQGLNHVADIVKINTNKEKSMIFSKDLIMTLYNSLKQNEDAYISLIRIKKSFAVMSDNIRLKNMPDFKTFSKMFLSHGAFESKNVETKSISISYAKYSKTMIPTDMGLLAVRSLLLPMVHKNIARIKVDSKNKVLNMQIDYQHVQWMHAKHGLEFYDPIMDVYHKVHKIHALDASYPVLVNITFNMAERSLKFQIKKHEPQLRGRFGMRSHVSTMVYMTNIDETTLNNVKHTHRHHQRNKKMVTGGDEDRQNYTVIDKGDMMTGTHWKVMVFNTEQYVSNGTWENFMTKALDPRKKCFQNPLGYMILSQLNWQQRIIYQPKVGTRGLLIRIDPIEDDDVTSVDLNICWNYEFKIGEYIFRPGMKLNNKITYSLKSSEKTLKTWDVDTTWEINAGHTNSKLKMDFTRIIPEQKDYKVCLEATKKMTDHDVSGKLSVVMSQSEDGKCSMDDAMIDVTMTGIKSHEQESEHHMYGTCQYAMPHFTEYYHTLQCLAEHSTVRKYVYNINISSVPMEFKKYIMNFWDEIKGYHMMYYNMDEEHNLPIKENSIKVEVIYPMTTEHVDVTIYTPNKMHSITGVPTDMYKWFGVYPDNTKYSSMFVLWHTMGLMDYCEVTMDRDHVTMHFNEHFQEHKMSKEWTMYMGNIKQPKQAVYLKQVNEHQMATKIVHESNTMEVHPLEGQVNVYTLTVNGKVMPPEQIEFMEEWSTYHHITSLLGSPVVITMPNAGMHLELYHNATLINMLMAKVDHGWKGRCTEHH